MAFDRQRTPIHPSYASTLLPGAGKRLGVTGRPLFSLKGWNNKAQGSALGWSTTRTPSPERAKQLPGPHIVAPFQGKNPYHTPFPQGAALGYLVSPLRGSGAGKRLRPRLSVLFVPSVVCISGLENFRCAPTP